MTSDHDPARPGVADLRAVLATARAVLAADPDLAHRCAADADCPQCAIIAAVQFGFALAAELTGAGSVSGPLHARLLDVIDTAQRELDTWPN